jgi:hypothetical protein
MFDEWQAQAVEEGATDAQQVSVPGRPSAFAGADAVKYTTEIPDPRDGDDDIAILDFRGLYAHATVEVTGDRIDGEGAVDHDAYFEPLRIPFEPTGDDRVVVTCRAPENRFGGLHATDAVPDEDAVPGIWWDASLESHSLPALDRIDVRPEITEEGARLHVRTSVLTAGPLDERITYSLRPEGESKTRGMMERAHVEADGPGVTTVEHTIEIRDPALWWPRELGEQNRYTLRAKLAGQERTVTTGICETAFEDGQLHVNGTPLSIRGVNLLTDDGADIERALDVNANLVRAHAHVLPQSVYERCDEQGLLVWQDMPLTGPGSFDRERGIDLAERLGRAYEHHPSLAAFGVHDDPVAAFEDGLGTGILDRLRVRYRAWRSSYDPEPARAVAEALPDRPVFPVVGGPGVDGDAGSYYPGWDYGDAAGIDDLLDRYPVAVLAEYGAGALAEAEVADAAGFDAAKHDRHVGDGVDESQAYQADTLQTVTERLRQRDVGAIAYALRDTDSAGMGVYGVDGTAKAARATLERDFAPVQAFLADPAASESAVVVVNDLPQELSATLSWEAGERTGEEEFTISPNSQWETDPISVDADQIRLTVSVGSETIENVYDRS